MSQIGDITSLFNTIKSRNGQDQQQLLQLGGQVNSAQKNLTSLLSDPNADPGKVALAQMDFEKASQVFQAKMSLMEAVNKIIDRIIQNISQIGR